MPIYGYESQGEGKGREEEYFKGFVNYKIKIKIVTLFNVFLFFYNLLSIKEVDVAVASAAGSDIKIKKAWV